MQDLRERFSCLVRCAMTVVKTIGSEILFFYLIFIIFDVISQNRVAAPAFVILSMWPAAYLEFRQIPTRKQFMQLQHCINLSLKHSALLSTIEDSLTGFSKPDMRFPRPYTNLDRRGTGCELESETLEAKVPPFGVAVRFFWCSQPILILLVDTVQLKLWQGRDY